MIEFKLFGSGAAGPVDPGNFAVYYTLRQQEDGSVSLVLVNCYGEPYAGGYLLNFTLDGTIVLYTGVSPAFGLPLTNEGTVIIS